jgi:hypothetical protein
MVVAELPIGGEGSEGSGAAEGRNPRTARRRPGRDGVTPKNIE